MNILQAAKSGRSFRISPDGVWIRLSPRGDFFEIEFDSERVNLLASEILADTYEVKESAVTITKTQFVKVFVNTKFDGDWVDFRKRLLFKLGLEE